MVDLEPAGGKQPDKPGKGFQSTRQGIADASQGCFLPPPPRQAIAAMTCVVLAMFLSALSQTVIATTMPLIIADLGGFDQYTWAATSYVVAATLAYPIVGRLSDIYGRRLFLMLGLAVFCIGSLLLGFCKSMTQMVAFRVVQGVGGGAVMTCCYVSVADLFPAQDRGRFHGILSAVYGASFVVGPLLGGVLAEVLSWQWAFLIIGFTSVPVLGLIAWVFPKPAVTSGGREFDLLGMIALILAVTPLLVALSSAGLQYSWSSPLILGLLFFSLLMTATFIAIETRARSPIMPLSLYVDPVVALAVVIMLLASFGLYGSVLFLPLLFQIAFDVSAAQSGGLLTPVLLGMVVGGVVAGQALTRASASYRLEATVFAGLMTGGLLLLTTVDETVGMVQSQCYIVLAGLGIGGIVATLSIGVQNHVPFDVVGVATSALQFYRSVGGVLGLAMLGVVLVTRFASSLEQAVPETVRAALAPGRFDDLRSDPQGLLNSAAADRLRAEMLMIGPDGAVLAQELLDSLGAALREALQSVFFVAFCAAAVATGLAVFFRVTLRPGPMTEAVDQARQP